MSEQYTPHIKATSADFAKTVLMPGDPLRSELVAKNFLEKFNDISLLADLMGHESIETTRIYLRRTSTEQRSIVDKVVTW